MQIQVTASRVSVGLLLLATAPVLGLECYALRTSHSGMGSDATATPLGSGTAWDEWPVAGSFAGPVAVHAADLDGDGDLDLLGAASSGHAISWWENFDGAGTDWIEHPVEQLLGRAYSVFSGDLDSDGDVDILGASIGFDATMWWENLNGLGTYWEQHEVGDDFERALSVHTGDIDGDGDLDVLGASFGHSDVSWWENRGFGTVWTEHAIDTGFKGATAVRAADVDGDGDLDAAGVAWTADDVAWWENVDGSGDRWTEHLVDGSFFGAQSIDAADVDGDGDLDLLAAAGSPSHDVAWWENVDGGGTSWVEHTVDQAFRSARAARPVDMDGDGDIDILGASFGFDQISWWENEDGSGRLWTERSVGEGFLGAWWVIAADVDGDGDDDVVGAAYTADAITWWENRYDSVCADGEYRSGDRLAVVAAPDPGWGVDGWTGTADDTSTSVRNTVVMPAADHEVVTDYVEGPGVVLTVAGGCPGEIDWAVTGATPGEWVVLARSGEEGPWPIEDGPCTGSEMDLVAPSLLSTATADLYGEVSTKRNVTVDSCGNLVQALETGGCSVSGLTEVPQ